MKTQILYAGLGAALFAGAPVANAQTIVTGQVVGPPVETIVTQPSVQTVRTVETVGTVRPALRHSARRHVVTTRRTVVREVPVRTVVVAGPQPLYGVMPSAPVGPVAYPQPPLYDTVAPAPVMPPPGPMPVSDDLIGGAPPPVGVPYYHYIYEQDRILVIDPNTNIAVEAIPR